MIKPNKRLPIWQTIKDINSYLNSDIKQEKINTLSSWNWNESPDHFFTKAMIFKILRERDKNVFSEVRIMNGIADIFSIDDQIIYEVESVKNEETRKKKLDQFRSYLIKDIVIIYIADLPQDWAERYEKLKELI